MMKKLTVIILIVISAVPVLQAQDTLPKFSVKNVGNDRIIIGWVNNYADVTQISIQRSFDSISGFKTILTVTDPLSPQNGFVDAKATNDHMFYRLYIMKGQGHFLFSDSKRPVLDTLAIAAAANASLKTGFDPQPLIPKNAPPGFIPSQYVYTHLDGYVNINLPQEEKPKKYSIKFFDEEGEFLFEIKEVKERNFKIDRTNFYHAGWFRFELYEDGKLMEKHKFFLEKDF
jgi:hypothetical protein